MIMVNDDGCYMVNDDGYYVVNDISIIFYILSMGDLQDPKLMEVRKRTIFLAI